MSSEHFCFLSILMLLGRLAKQREGSVLLIEDV